MNSESGEKKKSCIQKKKKNTAVAYGNTKPT